MHGQENVKHSPGYLYPTWWILCKSTENEGKLTVNVVGRDSSVTIATCCELYGSGIGFLWGVGGQIFRTSPHLPWGSPSLLYNGYRVSFSGGKAAGSWPLPPIPVSRRG